MQSLEVNIPGMDAPLRLEAIVLDYNGTIARDGKILDGVAERLEKLAEQVPIYVLTADTFGSAAKQCAALPVELKTFPKDKTTEVKAKICKELGVPFVAIGNGQNDIQMFDLAELAIGIMEKEGICAKLISHADVMVSSPADALDLLLIPNRLRATLRN